MTADRPAYVFVAPGASGLTDDLEAARGWERTYEQLGKPGTTYVRHDLFAAMADAYREVWTVLESHWLSTLECSEEDKTDVAACACGKFRSQPQPSVGAAVQAWVGHVRAIAAGRTE